jgi:hypothetical protein
VQEFVENNERRWVLSCVWCFAIGLRTWWESELNIIFLGNELNLCYGKYPGSEGLVGLNFNKFGIIDKELINLSFGLRGATVFGYHEEGLDFE